METKKHPAPIVHINGTDATTLLQQQTDIINACVVLMDALSAATPHDRDYYVQGPHAGPLARTGHAAQLGKVREIYDRAEWIGLAIQEQMQ